MAESSAYSRFAETCQASSGFKMDHQEMIWKEIRNRHSADGRHYHTLSHLLSMFDFIKRAVKSSYSLQDPEAVDWAVWFHDIVYDARNTSNNEAASAELAGSLLSAAGVQANTVSKVQRYIMATKEHCHLEGDPDADIVVDADLSILGAPLPKYIEYAVAVRKEHGHLNDREFAQGRARVLKSLLDREQLFLTDIGKSTCEAAARANMAHEWRLVYAGQLLQPTTIDEDPEEVTEESLGLNTADSLCSIEQQLPQQEGNS